MKEPVYWQTAYARFSRLSFSLSLTLPFLFSPLSPSDSPHFSLRLSFSLLSLLPTTSVSLFLSRALQFVSVSRKVLPRSLSSVRPFARSLARPQRIRASTGTGEEREQRPRRQARRVVSGYRKRAVSCVCWPVHERTPRCIDLSFSLLAVSPRACLSASLSLSPLPLFLPPLFIPSFCIPLCFVHYTRGRSIQLSTRERRRSSVALSIEPREVEATLRAPTPHLMPLPYSRGSRLPREEIRMCFACCDVVTCAGSASEEE